MNHQVNFNVFTRVISNTFVAAKSSYKLTIRTTQDGGALTVDRTTMIDDVQILRPSAGGVLV